MALETQKAPHSGEIVIILSDRSRRIIRLFEEQQRKRQQGVLRTRTMVHGYDPLIIAAIVFSIGLAATAIVEFTMRPAHSRNAAITMAAHQPVRIVGPAFVPNVNPRER